MLKRYTRSPKTSLDTSRTDSRPGERLATFLSSARIVKAVSAIQYASEPSWYMEGVTYSKTSVLRTEQSFHRCICVVHSVMIINFNNKYTLYNSIRGIGVRKEI